MKTASGYEIELEQGEALKKFYELTEQHLATISERIFEKVSKLAKLHGFEVITVDNCGQKEVYKVKSNG